MNDDNTASGHRPDDRDGLPTDSESRSAINYSFGGNRGTEDRAAVSAHVSSSWRRDGQSRAEGLVSGATDERPSADDRAHPWTPGLHMEVRARGALVSRDRELHRSVGHGGYANQVYGNRLVKTGIEHSVCSSDRTVVVQGAPGLGSDILPNVQFGHDRLHVAEDATVEFRNRFTMMSGALTRRILGGSIKAAAMEGVICGGALVRTIGGPSASVSVLSSSDVYGGAARVALARIRFGLLHYRSAVGTAWANIGYVRRSTFLIEPVVSVQPEGPTSNVGRKLGRLAKVFGVVRMVCPLVDIAAGVIGLVGTLGFGLFRLIRNKVKGKKPPPATNTVPRLLTSRSVFSAKSFSFMQFM